MRVSRIADWSGWCTPCGRDDSPLVLTRSGPGGVRAWLGGVDDDDRLLLLTCRVCGEWQVVPPREEDDPEVVVAQDPPPVVAVVPAPRREAPAAAKVVTVLTVADVLALPTGGRQLVLAVAG